MRDACFPEGPRRIRGGGLPRSGTACILHGRLHAAVLPWYDGDRGQRSRLPDDLRPCLQTTSRGPSPRPRRGAPVFRIPAGPCYAEDGCFSKLGFPGPVACGGAFSMPSGTLVPAEQDRSQKRRLRRRSPAAGPSAAIAGDGPVFSACPRHRPFPGPAPGPFPCIPLMPGHGPLFADGGFPFHGAWVMMDGAGMVSSAGPPPRKRRGALPYHEPGVRARAASARTAAVPTMMCSPRPPVR